MVEVILCVGSNVAEGEFKIRQALLLLDECYVGIIDASGTYRSSADSTYLNCVAKAQTLMDYESLLALTKKLEQALGRTPSARAQGLVPVDIDIVIYDGEIIRASDYRATYFKIGYERLQRSSSGE